MTMDSKLIPPNSNAQHHTVGKPTMAGCSAVATLPSRLFITTQLEQKDDFDEKHDHCYNMVMGLMADKSEKEAHDSLSITVGKDQKTHEEVCVGFTVAILSPQAATDSIMAGRHYRDLTFVSRDGLQCVIGHLNHLVVDKYLKMVPGTKQQLMWMLRELIRNNVVGTDNLCWNLMRQIAGGDVSRNNLWLAEVLIDIYTEFRLWLEKFQFLVASVVYTYLRVIEDHTHSSHEKLREKEVMFVVSLIRDRFNDVSIIGRDLLRLLQYVAKIPEFETLWRDILYNPKSLSPTFGGFVQLMHSRTSRRFLQSRVTTEMEKKLVFLTSQVRFGTHKRYQDWFQRQYLSTTESQSLRCDLIRFIVGVIHPTNELLCSDIIPRWAVIGWLLTTCTSQVAGSNAKLALFYDWLFFVPDKDNIMNIEPAILVMHHSMRPHPAITATLLDFLCRIINNFYPNEQEGVRNGIYNSLRMILDKRVLPSLSPLFENPKLDKELQALLRERFSPFCGKEEDNSQLTPGNFAVENEESMEDDEDCDVSQHEEGAAFSDSDDESSESHKSINDDSNYHHNSLESLPSGESDRSSSKSTKIALNSLQNPVVIDGKDAPSSRWYGGRSSNPDQAYEKKQSSRITESNDSDVDGEELDEDLKEILNEFKASQDDGEKQCETMDQLVKRIISEELNYEQCTALASNLAELLQEQFEGQIFPADNPTEDAIEDSIGKPLFVIFRALCGMTESGPHRVHLLQLLAELYTLQPRIGYYLLYFLNASSRHIMRDSKSKANVYRDLCEAIDQKYSLDICLVNDMRQCQEDDVNLFVYLIPDIYRNFAKHAVGNVDLLYLVVSCVDGRQVQTLVCHVVARDFIMFKKDSIQMVLSASLSWETFEQYALWQLISSHDLPFDCVLPLVPRLDAARHSEALTSVLLLLKQEKPTADVLKNLLSREIDLSDRFVSSCLINWMQEYGDKLGEMLSSYLCKQTAIGNNKRKRNQPNSVKNGSLSHMAELTLAHLDQLRQTCSHYDFFEQRGIQTALQQVRHWCTELQKKKFMDLFALADSDSESDDSQPLRRGGGKSGSGSGSGGKSGKNSQGKQSNSAKLSGKVSTSIKVSDSSGDSSDDSEGLEKPARSGSGKRSGRSGKATQPGNSRKRAANKISYKEVESTDDSSDENDVLSKKLPKKRRIRPPSDSD